MMLYSSEKLHKYADIPFRIHHCPSCDCELPEYDKMCLSCIKNGQFEDVYNLQKNHWIKYVYYPYKKKLNEV